MPLPITYFGPISWYRVIVHSDGPAVIEAHENYTKQTFRNRMQIATANGVQTLSVPVNTSGGEAIRDVGISDHGNWRHQHWEALKTAYGMSPFFEYYADDIQPFFTERWDKLFDFDLAITQKMFSLIGIDKEIILTDAYCGTNTKNDAAINNGTDTKNGAAIKKMSDSTIEYYQTFQRRHGFIPDLSILDLLFNEGPESIMYIAND